MVSSRLSHDLTVLHCAANAAVVGLPPVLLLNADGARRQVREHDHAMRMHLTTAGVHTTVAACCGIASRHTAHCLQLGLITLGTVLV